MISIVEMLRCAQHDTIRSKPIKVNLINPIKRSKIYHGEDFRGYIASKKRYFYGLRIHIMATEQGEPVEFFLEPGAFSDARALGLYNFDVPQHSFITGDKAYNDYTIEDVMRAAGVELLPLRKKELASSRACIYDLLPSQHSQNR